MPRYTHSPKVRLLSMPRYTYSHNYGHRICPGAQTATKYGYYKFHGTHTATTTAIGYAYGVEYCRPVKNLKQKTLKSSDARLPFTTTGADWLQCRRMVLLNPQPTPRVTGRVNLEISACNLQVSISQISSYGTLPAHYSIVRKQSSTPVRQPASSAPLSVTTTTLHKC